MDLDQAVTAVPKNSLKYLYSVDSYLSNFGDVNILKCHYLQKCRKIEAQGKLSLPAKLTKPAVKCQKCNIARTVNSTVFRIRNDVIKNRFTRRLLRKLNGKHNFTEFQRNYLRRIKNYFGNKLVMHCRICNTEVEENLIKTTNGESLEAINKPSRSESLDNNSFGVSGKQESKYRNKKLPPWKKKKNDIKSSGIESSAKMKKDKKKRAGKLNAILNTTYNNKSASLKDFLKNL